MNLHLLKVHLLLYLCCKFVYLYLYFYLYLYLYLYYHHHPSTIKTEDGWLTHESGKGYGTLEQPINHDYHSHMGAFFLIKSL